MKLAILLEMCTCDKRPVLLSFLLVTSYHFAWCVSDHVFQATLETKHPEILDVGTQMDIVSDSKLSISCRGNDKLYWIFPDHSTRNDHASIKVSRSNDSYKSILEIQSVKYNHTGIYRCCFASNYSPNCQSIYVFVNDEEHLFLPINDVVVVYRSRKSVIPCKPTFSNLSVALWKRDQYVSPGDNIIFKPTEGFIVQNSSQYFSGFFCCKARVRDKEEKITVELYYEFADMQPPRISVDGVLDIPKGSSIEIQCRGEKEMYWTLPQNVLFLNETRRKDVGYPKEISVRIEQARTFDSGPFMCCYLGYDCHPTLTASYAFLRVNDGQNLYISEVETVITKDMLCVPYVVACIPSMANVTVQLVFRKMDNSSNSTIDCQDDFSYLQTVGFVPKDFRKIRTVYKSGMFVCKYTYGSRRAEETKSITPLAPRYSIKVWPSKADLFENSKVEFICQACKFAFESIVWRKSDGNAIPTSTVIKLSDESTKFELKKVFKLDSINREDGGTYECVGITRDNLEEKEEVEVNVKAVERPTFIETNMNGSNVTVKAGKKLELLCMTQGAPRPKITWYRNNQLFNETNSTIGLEENGQKLILIRVTRNQGGTYRCKAENLGGSVSAQLLLIVSTEKTNGTETGTQNFKRSVTFPLTVLCALLSVGIFLCALLIIRNVMKNKRRYFI